MFGNKKGVYYATFFVILALTVSGCDIITSITEYFSKSKKAATESPVKGDTAKGPLPADVLVRIGDWSITQSDFEERLNALKEVVPDYKTDDPQSRALVLDELIRQQLLIMDAEESGLADDKDIKSAVDEFRRTLIIRQVAQSLTGNVTVSDEEAKEFYEANKDQIIEPRQWRVREMVVPTKVRANEILVQILSGADFAQLARENSTGKTAASGGDLGFISEEPFPEMATAILSLEEGGVSGVFKGPNGYYIVKLEEIKGGEQIPFEEVKEDIIQNQLLLKQQQAVLDHLQKIQQRVNIEINEQLL